MSDDTIPLVPERTDLSALEDQRRKRTRRRLTAWGALLALGLILGVIYATGFATTGGTEGSTGPAAANTNDPAANQDSSALAGQITAPNDLTFNWSGRWGTIDTAVMYEVDLTPFGAGEKFFSEVLLTNTPSGFSDLQLQVRIAEAAGASCANSDLTGTAMPANGRVMIFDTDDAQVTFSGMGGATTGLPGGAIYCIGVVDYGPNPASGKDTGGTFIRKSQAGGAFGGDYPEFVGTLNRMP